MSRHKSNAAAPTQSLAGLPSPHREELSDEFLMHALAGGTAWAMDPLYQRYSALLYSLAYRMVANRQVAEDLLQDVFLAIWLHAASYSPQSGSVRNWLFSIMHNRTVDYIRSMRRRSALKEITWEEAEQDEDPAFPDAWEDVWRSIQRSLVRECLMKLSIQQRMVIELAYFQGLTHVEIAREYQIPLGTVKERIRFALLHLKRELEKRGVVEV